jgi:hypothetical protein
MRGIRCHTAFVILLSCAQTLVACSFPAVPVESDAAASGPIDRPSPRAQGERLLLPDLIVRKPGELYMTTDPSTGVRRIRFSTSIVNVGEGPLEVIGRSDPATRMTIATQRIRDSAGGTTVREAGTFVFHPTHDHWHFEEFTTFEIWSYAPDGSLTVLHATTDKMSFCIWDRDRMQPPLRTGAPRATYGRCPRNVQGLSVGWVDTYSARTLGQHLDIGTLPDGNYAIRSTVDPAQRLNELNESNNSSVEYVGIRGFLIDRAPG